MRARAIGQRKIEHKKDVCERERASERLLSVFASLASEAAHIYGLPYNGRVY